MQPVGPAPLPLDSPGGASWPCPAPLGLTWWSQLALPRSPWTHLVEPVGPAPLPSDSPGGAGWPCPALLRLTWWSRLALPSSPQTHLVEPVGPAQLSSDSPGGAGWPRPTLLGLTWCSRFALPRSGPLPSGLGLQLGTANASSVTRRLSSMQCSTPVNTNIRHKLRQRFLDLLSKTRSEGDSTKHSVVSRETIRTNKRLFQNLSKNGSERTYSRS